MQPLRVPGHTLQHAGRAHGWSGDFNIVELDGKVGFGVCSCGQRSEPLPTRTARERWHRAHRERQADLIAIEQDATITEWERTEQLTAFHFRHAAQGHVMKIVHDGGPTRYLDFRTPGQGGIDSWQITTMPRALVMTGDRGTFVFRTPTDNSITFFNEAGPPDPTYWARMLLASEYPAREYDPHKAVALVVDKFGEARSGLEWLVTGEDMTLEKAFEELQSHDVYIEHEREISSFTTHYLWACHAVQYSARQYVASKTADRDLPGSSK